MKKISSFTKSLAAATLMLLSVTACHEGYEYQPAAPETGSSAQVYFDSELPATVELAKDATSFDLTLNRLSTDGVVTVDLTTTQPEPAIYNVPATATFADGASETTVTVTVDPANLEYDDMRALTITVDPEQSTAYAPQTYAFTVGVPAPWTPWCSSAAEFEEAGGMAEWPLGEVGTGDYTFGAMLTGGDSDKTVQFRQNKVTGETQFRILDLATSFYPNFKELVIEAVWWESLGVYALRMPMIDTGYVNEGEPIYLFDGLSFSEILGGQSIDWEHWDQYKPELQCYYNPATGLFVFNVFYCTAGRSGWKGTETLQMHGFYVPDYTAEVVYSGIFTDKDGALAAVANGTFGTDATDVRAVVMPQEADASAVADALAAAEAPTEDLPYVSVESGRFEVPFNPEAMGSEKLQIVAAVVVDGAAVNVARAPFEYYGGGENPWQSIGTGLYTDDIVMTSYFRNIEAPTYEVEIMEHTKTPGLYRVMNPYTQAVHPYGNVLVNEVGAIMAPEGSFLEFNAEDPDAAYVPMQSIEAVIDEGDGAPSFCTYGYYGVASGQLSFDDAKTRGLMGKCVDGVIDFPRFYMDDTQTSTFQLFLWFNGDGPYYGGTTSGISLVLPDAVEIEKTMAKAKASLTKRALARRDAKSFKLPELRKTMSPAQKIDELMAK